MPQQIVISHTWCDDHLTNCLQSYNTATGLYHHIESYTDEVKRLIALGYYYAGHHAGQYTYSLRTSRLLNMQPDWQIAMDREDAIDENQDW